MLSHPNINVNSKCRKYDGSYNYETTPLKRAVAMNKFDVINILLNLIKYEIERKQVNII